MRCKLLLAVTFAVAAGCCVVTVATAQQTTTSRAESAMSYAHHTPFACATVLNRVAHVAAGKRRVTWRERWPDTVAAIRVADSLGRLAVERLARDEIRRCLDAHPTVPVPLRQQFGVALAQLAAGDDTLANATWQQLLQTRGDAPVAERAWLLSLIVDAYAGAGPKHIPAALRYMAQLDSMGSAAAGRRVVARISLYGLAQGMDSLPFMEAQARAALRMSQTLQGDAKVEWARHRAAAHLNWADVMIRRGEYAAALAFLTGARQDFSNGELDDMIFRLAFYGKPVQPLTATFLFVPGDTHPVTRPPLPEKGKPTLLVAVSYHDLEQSMPTYTMLQRINAKYHRDVNIVLVTETSGWDYDQLLPKPEAESSRIRSFFHDYLAMPAPIVVWARRSNGALGDGRLTFEPNPNPVPGGMGRLVLVDKMGVIRMMSDGGQELRFNHMIEELAR